VVHVIDIGQVVELLSRKARLRTEESQVDRLVAGLLEALQESLAVMRPDLPDQGARAVA
jgi:hypothetical protein